MQETSLCYAISIRQLLKLQEGKCKNVRSKYFQRQSTNSKEKKRHL